MKINEETIIQILDSLYDNVILGLPGSETVYELSNAYLQKNSNPKSAADSLIRWQTAKCATSGFLSGIGGALVLPVSMPADLAATYYIQMRMIACIAHLNGYDIRCEQVRSFIYCCLLGDSMNDALKQAGLKLGKQLTKKAIHSMSREFLFKINKAVGSKLISKFGGRTVIGMSRFVPIAGGVVGAGMNGYFCYEIGRSAQILFPIHYEVPAAA